MNYYRHYDDCETVSTSSINVGCSFCGRDLSNYYVVTYLDGRPICDECLAKVRLSVQ